MTELEKQLLERIDIIERSYSLMAARVEKMEAWILKHEEEIEEDTPPVLRPPAMSMGVPLFNVPPGINVVNIHCQRCGEKLDPRTFTQHKCAPPAPPTQSPQ